MSQTAAERKRAQRARNRHALTVTVELTEDEAAKLAAAYDVQNAWGTRTEFYAAALITGAAFVANAGTPRGRKIKS